MQLQYCAFVKPFAENSGKYQKRSLGKPRNRAGVYLIKEDGVLVYVGMSRSCVAEAMYRHFYKWRDCYRGMGREYRTTYFDMMDIHQYEVFIIETITEQAHELERALIMSLKPRDNREKYDNYIEDLINEHKSSLAENDVPF